MGDEKRYYYTDRLAAAWMTKQFNMKFEGASISSFHCSVFSDGKNTPHYFSDDGNDDFKGIIHPLSLPLLEPQKGDWLYLDGEMYRCLKKETAGENAGRAVVWYGDEEAWLSPRAQIIQRDGKPFFWPESEE